MSNPKGELHLKIYSFSQKKASAEEVFEIAGWMSQFELDPTRQKVTYTFDETDTGLIDLPGLLRTMGL